MKVLTFALLFFSVAFGALAQTPLNAAAARTLLARDDERTWQLETSETIASGGLCDTVPTYVFFGDGRLEIRGCQDGSPTVETDTWTVTTADDGKVLLRIGSVGYELYAKTHGKWDFVLLQTPFERRLQAGVEFELSSKRE